MMKKSEEDSMMDHEKQVTPLEREIALEDAFIKGSVFAMHERGLRKKSNVKNENNTSSP